MKTVAFVTQKGGTGKSSLAVSMAVAAQERGLKVYVIDLDPQGTAKSWYERREAPSPEVATIETPQLPAALATLARQGYDLALIDTAGVDSPATTAAMQAADLCLIPARPSIADIEATRPTVRTLSRLGRPFSFVLNQCPPGRTIRTSDAFRVLNLAGAVAGTAMAMRADHLDSMAMGLGVTERDPTGKAASEMRELLQWVTTRLEGKTNGQEETRVA
ncbi:cobyrinic acid a,c-diamide synthase [Alsobacter soli]|uniref:Cobyrinic acid a,c-diamide synthase n=1 Tax=Alsobacter soli TaxID=2109933 RepID=A0A2T1HM36_9HYPH|nr:ParA family protein [Alsobacter soli]PSC02688.1 cobyrinic acid a,c-diamide synthase [Alsobacter soli]